MLRFKVLGSPSLLTEDEVELHSVVQQPKRLALLSYLCVMSHGGYVRRDRLLGLFWPDSTEKRARASLSEALSRLRASCGDDVIATRGDDEVGICADSVWCDAVEMVRAVDREDPAAVAELYRGPLLDGLVLDGTHELEQWLSLTRSQYARTALDALGRLSDQALAAGEDHAARVWAERSYGLDPLDGGAARRVMRVLAHSGQRAAALDVYEEFAGRLMEERGIAPPPETVALMESIRDGRLPSRESPEPGRAVPETRPPAAGATGVGRGTSAARESWSPVAVAAAIFVATLVGLVTWGALAPDRPLPPVVRYGMALGDDEPLRPGDTHPRLALSPDGSKLLYLGPGEGNDLSQLYLRSRDELHSTKVPGTRYASNPFFSPDGTHFGYLRYPDGNGDRHVMVASLGGGVPVSLVGTGVDLNGASWGDDGFIYYDGLTAGTDIGIMRVAADGGSPEQVTSVDSADGESDHVWPSVLPGSRALLFTVLRGGDIDRADIAVLDMESGERRTLLSGVMARYVDPGYLLVMRPTGELVAARFDPIALEVDGEPAVVAEGLGVRLGGAVDLAYARGTLAYVTGIPTYRPAQLVWVDRQGHSEPVEPAWYDDFGTLDLSPDGSRLAISTLPGGHTGIQDLFVKDFPAGSRWRLSVGEPAQNHRPVWWPDGEWVMYVSDGSGEHALYRRRADGTGRPEVLIDDQGPIWNADISPDAEWILYENHEGIFATKAADRSDHVPLIVTDADERDPELSPDGRWMAYVSNESGSWETYIVPFPNVGDWRRLISNGSGVAPVWAHDGREIFYRRLTGEQMLVTLSAGDPPDVVSREVVYTAPDLYRWRQRGSYALTLDDQRILTFQSRHSDEGELVFVDGFDRVLQETVGP